MSEGSWAATCPTCKTRYKWEGAMSPTPPCPACKRRLEAEQRRAATPGMATAAAGQSSPQAPARGIRIPLADDQNSRVSEAIELCDEIESAIDDMPEAGMDFAISVSERAADIRRTIEANNRATDGQITALHNMLSGLSAWIRD